MLCQSCGKKPATTHIKAVVNGKLTEVHLCDDCARERGYGNWFSQWDMDLGKMLGGLMENRPTENVLRCKKCGMSFEEFARTGKVGCAECYQTFRKQLLPIIERIHGAARHRGKIPGGAALKVGEQNNKIVPAPSEIEAKRKELQKAIENQEFERAAVLRDQIKEMENDE